MKLRLEVRKSSAGSSNPVTGGISGLRIGEFCWPKAGAGAVSAGCVVVWAARFMLRPTIRNTVIRIFFMLFTRGSLVRVFCANGAALHFLRTAFMAPQSCPPAVTDSYRSEEHTSELQSLRHLVCR